MKRTHYNWVIFGGLNIDLGYMKKDSNFFDLLYSIFDFDRFKDKLEDHYEGPVLWRAAETKKTEDGGVGSDDDTVEGASTITLLSEYIICEKPYDNGEISGVAAPHWRFSSLREFLQGADKGQFLEYFYPEERSAIAPQDLLESRYFKNLVDNG
ncbi:MAG: hypothetical protein LBO21_06530 [Synergistaceae bacterium]|jgi:hypothetical protein|nr:hypothetical protein [Synergistaceae bacterium]